MARSFVVASSIYLSSTTVPATAAPVTLAAWAKATDATTATTQSIMSFCDTGGANNAFRLDLNATTGVVRATTAASTTASASTSASPSDGVWFHACGVFASATDRRAFLDGANKGTNATSRTPSGIDATRIGNHSTGTEQLYFGGDIAEAAAWDVALTDDEVATLAKGVSPLFVRPGNLIAYWPLIGNASPEIDLVGRFELTLNNTPGTSAHPRVYMPRQRKANQYGLTSAALTGTATASITEADIVTGGKTIILTLTGDTWVTAGATFDAQRQNIIDGIDSAQSEANGWDAVVKATQGVAGVVRTSNTVVTITLDAFATYDITATETITATIPASALTGGVALVASPTFTVTAAAGAFVLGTGIYESRLLARPRLAA